MLFHVMFPCYFYTSHRQSTNYISAGFVYCHTGYDIKCTNISISWISCISPCAYCEASLLLLVFEYSSKVYADIHKRVSWKEVSNNSGVVEMIFSAFGHYIFKTIRNTARPKLLHSKIHRVREKKSLWFTMHNCNKFEYIFTVFGTNHRDSLFY